MILTIDLDETLRALLEDEARRRGLHPPEYARQLLERGLGVAANGEGERATLDLLAQWQREDQTDDPSEIEARRRELETMKRSMNDNRAGGRKPFPPQS